MRATIAVVVVLLMPLAASCKDKEPPKKAKSARDVPAKLVTPEPIPKPNPPKGTLPEKVPAPQTDSLFPSPKSAGTAAIFSLEEPDRGPLLTSMKLPSTRGMKFSRHATCELESHGLTCSKSRGKSGGVVWKVGRKGRTTMATRYRGKSKRGIVVLERDKSGALKRVVELSGQGLVREVWTFSEKGTRASVRARSGANGLPGCGSWRTTFDKNGRAATVTCLQWMGAPMRDSNGVAITKLERDASGFEIERRFFDPKGKPTERHDRVHRTVTTRDADGRVLETRAFDLKGEPAISEDDDGCHRLRSEYDDKGRLTASLCLDADNRLAAGNRNVASWRYRYDKRGCMSEMRQYGLGNQPIADTNGVHAFRWTSNRKCQRTGHKCLGVGGRLAPCGPDRAAEYRYVLDRDGNRMSVRHYDHKGRPGKNASHKVFELRYTFDERGRRNGTACYDEAGKASLCSQMGYHGRTTKLDDAGRAVEVRFFDVDGKPGTNLGVSIRRSIYNNYDHVHESTGHDPDGNPKGTQGMVKQRFVYDAGHRMFGMLLFDANGKPARYRACFSGMSCPGRPWHAIRIIRSDRGHVVKNLFFDHRKKLVGTIDCSKRSCWD